MTDKEILKITDWWGEDYGLCPNCGCVLGILNCECGEHQ